MMNSDIVHLAGKPQQLETKKRRVIITIIRTVVPILLYGTHATYRVRQ